jgi:4-amino-4-deoxy-L-arabinose transferase-like glycosyltransferase
MLRAFAAWCSLALVVRVATAFLFAGALERGMAGGIAHDAELFYMPLATSLIQDHAYTLHGQPATSHLPGYPLLLAGALVLFGSTSTAVLTLQIVFGSLVVGLVFLLGSLVVGRRVGHLAALLAALFPDLVAYSLLNLSESPFLAFELAASLAMLWALRADRRSADVVLGVCLALTLLVRESSAALIVLFAGILLLARSGAQRWRGPATVVVVVLAFLAPWWVRNAVVVGSFVPLTSKGSWNFYQGTMLRPYSWSDHRNRGVVLDPEQAAREAEVARELKAAANDAEAERLLRRAAFDNLRHDPLGQALHVGHKFVWLWSANIGPRHSERVGAGPLLQVAALAHFAVLGLGLVGLWMLRRNREAMLVLALPVLLMTAVHVIVGSGEPRYHFQAWPALMIGAAALADALLEVALRPRASTA